MAPELSSMVVALSAGMVVWELSAGSGGCAG